VPDPCSLVSPALVQKYFHRPVQAGKPVHTYLYDKECDLTSTDGKDQFAVSVSNKPGKTMPDSMYTAADPEKVSAAGVTRGGIMLPGGAGALYVVKNGIGVFVDVNIGSSNGTEQYHDSDGQGFADAIAAEL
jgi:hypothetical protein